MKFGKQGGKNIILKSDGTFFAAFSKDEVRGDLVFKQMLLDVPLGQSTKCKIKKGDPKNSKDYQLAKYCHTCQIDVEVSHDQSNQSLCHHAHCRRICRL